MTLPSGPSGPKRADDLGIAGVPRPTGRPPTSALDVVPVWPNLFATLTSFVALMTAPWICLHTLEGLWEDAIGEDAVATYFVLANLQETLVIATVGALFFLVIGLILQAWQFQWPFPSRWPIFLAFPIAIGLIVPESLLRGGSFISGVVVGSTVALAFAIHWKTLTFMEDALA